jgi:hypothetical protein
VSVLKALSTILQGGARNAEHCEPELEDSLFQEKRKSSFFLQQKAFSFSKEISTPLALVSILQ